MIRSMTGFATKTLVLETDEAKSNVSMNIKSLNSRYFEVTCRIPGVIAHLETEFIRLFKKQLHRGHIYFTIHMSNPNIFKGVIEPSLTVIKNYVGAINRIKTQYHIDEPLRLNHILNLPNIFNTEEQQIDEQSIQLLFEATVHLINQVTKSRILEGEQLLKDLVKRIHIMREEITAIEKLSMVAIEHQKTKIQEALKEVGSDESMLAEARKNALYVTLDKIDIHEEIIRFKSHLLSLEKLLNAQDEEKGKRLDFIFQELAREINTVTAKCSDADISIRAINIKVEVEKAREQVQNVV